MARFLCTGDLHLGAGADLGNAPGERLAEQEAVWLSIVKMANELEATILFAGDAWERRRPTPAELLAFFRPIELARIGPLVITGNHDVEAYDRPTGYDVRGHWHRHRPDVVSMGGALIACLPWAPPGKLIALDEGGDRDAINARLADGLVEIARGLYTKAVGAQMQAMSERLPVILLAHWSVGGAQTPTGVPVELFREPVLPLEALAAIGFDAIVLGHIHKPQLLPAPPAASNGRATPIFYVGSPMPLNFGEAESDHVVWLLDTESGPFQIPVESRRLVTIDADAIDLGDGGPVWAAGGKRTPQGNEPVDVQGAIVKVKIRATAEKARRIDVAQIKRDLLELGAHKVWSVQVDVEREQIARGVEIDETVDDVEAFDRWLAASGVTASSEDLFALHRDYLAELAS